MSVSRTTLTTAILASSLMAASTSNLYAANEISETNDIIVTASRINTSTNSATSFTTVITQDDIQSSTANTLPDLLDTEAGITSRSLYGNLDARANIDIRGFGAAASANTLILLDGRRLNDIDLSSVDLATIPLNNIDHIEIIRGGGSVLYGDGATGGTINIITKQAALDGTHGTVGIATGSYNNHQIDASINHNTGPIALHLSAALTDGDGYRDNNELTQRNLQGDLRLIRDNDEFYARFGYDNQALNLPGVRTVDPSTGLNEIKDDPTGTNTPNDYADKTGHHLSIGMSRFLSSDNELIMDLGYRNKEQQAFFDYGFGFSDYLDTTLSTFSVTPRLNISHTLLGPAGNATIGIDYYHSSYDSDRGLNKASIGTPIHRLDITQKNLAIYAHNTQSLNENTTVNVGLRVQDVQTDATDVFNLAAPGASSFDGQATPYDDSEQAQMASLGLRHTLNTQTTVLANIERSVRFATVDELYSNFPGNYSDIKPQTANTLSIGVEHQAENFQLTANLYGMRLKNEIHYDVATFSNINLDPTERKGLELSAKASLHNNIDINANATFTSAQFRDGIYQGNDVPVVAKHTASISAIWAIKANLKLTNTVKHVTEKFFDNDQGNDFGKKIPAYTTLDIKLAHQTGPWRTTLMVNNAFDESYYDYGVRSTSSSRYNGYPLPERNVSIALDRAF